MSSIIIGMDSSGLEKGNVGEGLGMTSEKVIGLASGHLLDSVNYWRGEMQNSPEQAAQAIREYQELNTKLGNGELEWRSVQVFASWGATRRDAMQLDTANFLNETFHAGLKVEDGVADRIAKTREAIMACPAPVRKQ